MTTAGDIRFPSFVKKWLGRLVPVVAALIAPLGACSSDDDGDSGSETGGGSGAGGATDSGGASSGGGSGSGLGGSAGAQNTAGGSCRGDPVVPVACESQVWSVEVIEACHYRVVVPESMIDTFDPNLIAVLRRNDDGTLEYITQSTPLRLCDAADGGWLWESMSDRTFMLCSCSCEYVLAGELEVRYGCGGPVYL